MQNHGFNDGGYGGRRSPAAGTDGYHADQYYDDRAGHNLGPYSNTSQSQLSQGQLYPADYSSERLYMQPPVRWKE